MPSRGPTVGHASQVDDAADARHVWRAAAAAIAQRVCALPAHGWPAGQGPHEHRMADGRLAWAVWDRRRPPDGRQQADVEAWQTVSEHGAAPAEGARQEQPLPLWRVDTRLAAGGLTSPPCSVRCWIRPVDDGRRIYAQGPPGRGRHVAAWLGSHGMQGCEAEQGLAPRAAWCRLPNGGGRLHELLDDAVRAFQATPQGTLSLFLQAREPDAGEYLRRVRCHASDARMRLVQRQVEAGPGLTAKQHEVLEVAVAAGYYEVPRVTTLRALAQTMGLSLGATSELLRRGERILLDRHFDDEALRPARRMDPW